MSAVRRIFLIRHGETPGNVGRVFQVPEPLHPAKGIDTGQAGKAIRVLLAEPVHVVVGHFKAAALVQITRADRDEQ